jgi:hypothetical protein
VRSFRMFGFRSGFASRGYLATPIRSVTRLFTPLDEFSVPGGARKHIGNVKRRDVGFDRSALAAGEPLPLN